VDFDGDGKADILSGSYATNGDLYFFRGLGGGKFAMGELLKDKGGALLKPGAASTAFAFDWNSDGLLDLLCGNIDGDVLLYKNEGSRGQWAFGAPEKLAVSGKSVKAQMGDAHPIAADWDSDGVPDLLLGGGDGSVTCYRNTGTRQEPRLGPGVTLVPKSKMMDQGAENNRTTQRGYRSKICVTDWNGDGNADLLVGDVTYTHLSAPKMTPALKQERDRAERAIKTAQKEMEPYFAEARKLSQPPNAADSKESMAKFETLSKKYAVQIQKYTQAHRAVGRYRGMPRTDGFVWLFLRANTTVGRR
jgi:hypothetical protein